MPFTSRIVKRPPEYQAGDHDARNNSIADYRPEIVDQQIREFWRELARLITFSICVRVKFFLRPKSANSLGNGAPGWN
jgi:hypothetical protein